MYQGAIGDRIRNSLKVFVCAPNGQWINVTAKQAVLYGAGQGCFALMNEMQLPGIRYVIDSDKNKWGKEIELLNTVYRIQSPEVLLSLNPEDYYIIITGIAYEREIKESIERNIGINRVLICNAQSVFYGYERIEDMFWYDPVLKRGILLSNLSFDVENIISLFKYIVKDFNQMTIDCFIPSKGGESKLVFFFGNEKELWVFSVPGLHNDWESMGIDRDRAKNREIRYKLRKYIDIDKKITVYEDKNGVLIQKYCGEYIDFSKDKIKKDVLKLCRKIHQIDKVIEIKNDMVERYFINLTEKVLKSPVVPKEVIKKAQGVMEKVLAILDGIEYTPKICHCDLFCSNIVSYKGELFFIDWEYMAMCDPMFDVCGLLFSIGITLYMNNEIPYENALQQVYVRLKHDLFIYYERECTEKEHLHAFLVLLIFEYRELIKDALSKGIVDAKKVKLLLERVDSVMEGIKSVCEFTN